MSAAGDEAATADRAQRPEKKGPARLIGRTLSKAWNGNVFSESAEAAFWQALSLAPLMLGLLGMLGYIGSWFGEDVVNQVSDQIRSLSDKVFSDEVSTSIVDPTVESMLTEGKAAIASVGFLIALWAGSSAMSSFVDAITVAHDQHGVRNEVWQRLFALLLYMGSLLLLIIGLPIIAIGPDLLPKFFPDAWQSTIDFWVGALYYPVLAILLAVALATLYKVALPRKLPWHRGLPGAVLAMAIFLLTSVGLRIYLEAITATGYTYGALATFVAFLLFLFFIGLAIVSGSYFNAAIEELWPAKPTRRQRRKWRRLEMERTRRSLQKVDPKELWGRTTGPLRRPRKSPEQATGEGGRATDDADHPAGEPEREAQPLPPPTGKFS